MNKESWYFKDNSVDFDLLYDTKREERFEIAEIRARKRYENSLNEREYITDEGKRLLFLKGEQNE